MTVLGDPKASTPFRFARSSHGTQHTVVFRAKTYYSVVVRIDSLFLRGKGTGSFWRNPCVHAQTAVYLPPPMRG